MVMRVTSRPLAAASVPPPSVTAERRHERRRTSHDRDRAGGFATINFWAGDVAAARDWYADFLGMPAYFERTDPDGRLAYAEFRVGDYEAETGAWRRPTPQPDLGVQ
jgi:hypothetical protein